MRKNTIIKSIAIIIIASIILFFAGRNLVLNYVLENAQNKLHNQYNLSLSYSEAGFKGIRSILFKQIQITAPDTFTVFEADTLFLQLRIWPLFKGDVAFRRLILTGSQANISDSLISKLLNSRKVKDTTDTSSITNYGLTAERLLDKFFTAVPNEIRIDSAKLRYISQTLDIKVNCPHFLFYNNNYNGVIEVVENEKSEHWNVNGTVDRDEKFIEFALFNNDKGCITIPALISKYETTLSFDTLKGSFSTAGYHNSALQVRGILSASNVFLSNTKVSPQPVKIETGKVDMLINIGEHYLELDSTSEVKVNKLVFSPYLKFEKNNKPHVIARIPRKEFEASALWNSFPEGLFSSVRDMKVSGKLAYSLNVDIDWNNLDSLIFDSRLERKDFKIQRMGNANLYVMNEPFLHEVYERDQPLRTIWTGPESPDFVPLNEVSDYLKYCVLTSEDGGFFYHRGFNEEAWQHAIAEDIRKKRFARGGSTISMQLVKNVYLNRNKTISRKLEEMLIVWMIENLRTVPKERMFEVYLNIIEWGPGVYGIKPAAWFYFKKKPSQLTLNESIFLASIIPSPKRFKSNFDSAGNLKPHLDFFYKKVSEIMLRRNQISPNDTVNLRTWVNLTGEAKKMLVSPDTMVVDSVEVEYPEL
jgi:hypothetical protein